MRHSSFVFELEKEASLIGELGKNAFLGRRAEGGYLHW